MSVGSIRLVTSNPGKAREASRLLGESVERVDLDLDEIQGSSLEQITIRKLASARQALAGDRPILVEDVGLGFRALGGFPGAYVRWLLESAGGAGLGLIARGFADRSATAACCLGFWDGRKDHVFMGQCDGEILPEPRGSGGFGWDAWFLPSGSQATYAEMGSVEKDAISHRGRAYAALREHLCRSEENSEFRIQNEE